MLKVCLCYAPWCIGGPFIATRDLGVVGAPFGSLVAFCLWVHRTVRCTPDTAQCNDYGSLHWWLSTCGGHWIVRWLALDCPVHLLTVGSGAPVDLLTAQIVR
jgi:hypothetical protein